MITKANFSLCFSILFFTLIFISKLDAKANNNKLNLANPTTDTTDSLSITYSPNTTVQASGILTVSNGTKTADNRSFCVVFTLTNPGNQGGLQFSLYNTSTGNQISLSGSPISATEVLSGSFPVGTAPNSKIVFPFEVRIAPDIMPLPGTYTAIISEKLYGDSLFPPSGAVLDTNTLTVSITVGNHYDVAIVAPNSSFLSSSSQYALEFGTLDPGLSLEADILVKSNVTYSLSLLSSNNGTLVNTTDPDSRIEYSVQTNGSPANLNSGPAFVAIGAPAAPNTPERYRIVITILAFSMYPSAGRYEDSITITLAAP